MQRLLSVLLAGLAPAIAVADTAASATYRLRLTALAAGGGPAAGASYSLQQLSGQPLVIGQTAASGGIVEGGFFAFLRAQEDLLGKRVTSLVRAGSTLLAAFDGAGIWYSANGGSTWAAATTQPANRHIRALVAYPGLPNRLYAASYGNGVYISNDGGVNWAACANSGLGNGNGLALAIAAGGQLYLGTEGGIYGSSSNCSIWTAINTGLTVAAATPPVALVVDTDYPTRIYAGLDGAGIFRSTDGGATWTAAATQPANLRIKALARQSSNQIYAGSYGGGVFVSSNGGVNWSACSAQPASPFVLSLLMDGAGRLYAGTADGVAVSLDACATWTAIDTGLP